MDSVRPSPIPTSTTRCSDRKPGRATSTVWRPGVSRRTGSAARRAAKLAVDVDRCVGGPHVERQAARASGVRLRDRSCGRRPGARRPRPRLPRGRDSRSRVLGGRRSARVRSRRVRSCRVGSGRVRRSRVGRRVVAAVVAAAVVERRAQVEAEARTVIRAVAVARGRVAVVAIASPAARPVARRRAVVGRVTRPRRSILAALPGPRAAGARALVRHRRAAGVGMT